MFTTFAEKNSPKHQFTYPIPLSLYIHTPWCIRKCPYCDFNSHSFNGTFPEREYIDALIQELEQHLPSIWGRSLCSIFIGGGTPSLFSGASIDTLLTAIRTRLPFMSDLEITMEANPGTAEAQRFKDFHQAGVNRLSLGVQSFQDDKLQALGRIHDAKQAHAAIEMAHTAGFDNINIDIMYGLPQQNRADASYDLQQAIKHQTSHLSWYQLTLEPNTVFYRYPPALPNDELNADIEQTGLALLKHAGLQRYEISAYAKLEKRCQHNLNYWQFGDYLGIGAGAHSKLTDVNTQTIHRMHNVKQPNNYLDRTKPFLAAQTDVDIQDAIFEFMLNALRLLQSVPFTLFEQRTGLSRALITPQLELARDRELIRYDDHSFKPTQAGYRYLNSLIELFLPQKG